MMTYVIGQYLANLLIDWPFIGFSVLIWPDAVVPCRVWQWRGDNRPWDAIFLSLLSRAVSHAGHRVDLEPHWPWLFSKVPRCFQTHRWPALLVHTTFQTCICKRERKSSLVVSHLAHT